MTPMVQIQNATVAMCCETGLAETTAETTGTTTEKPVPTEVIELSGSCNDWLNGMRFEKQPNVTANSFPYYKSTSKFQVEDDPQVQSYRYIYYDLDCMGSGGEKVPPRWIIDMDQPDISRKSDLD